MHPNGYFLTVRTLVKKPDVDRWHAVRNRIYCGVGNLGLANIEQLLKEWANSLKRTYAGTIKLQATPFSSVGLDNRGKEGAKFYEASVLYGEEYPIAKLVICATSPTQIEELIAEEGGDDYKILKIKESNIDYLLDFCDYPIDY